MPPAAPIIGNRCVHSDRLPYGQRLRSAIRYEQESRAQRLILAADEMGEIIAKFDDPE